MASKLIALESTERPGILFKHVVIDELFVGWDRCVYQKVSNKRCHRIQDHNGAMSASPNVKYAPGEQVRSIAYESFKIQI